MVNKELTPKPMTFEDLARVAKDNIGIHQIGGQVDGMSTETAESLGFEVDPDKLRGLASAAVSEQVVPEPVPIPLSQRPKVYEKPSKARGLTNHSQLLTRTEALRGLTDADREKTLQSIRRGRARIAREREATKK